MGAVASAMAKRGCIVTGSDDNVYPPMSTFLQESGIELFNGFSADNIPDTADIIVVGNAMSRGNPEVEAVLERRLRYLSLPETLKEYFLSGRRNYVVSGTHGKTTTTSMLTWIMEYAGLDPSFMIGGIPNNLKRGGRFTDSDFFVIEGDEYDTAFFDKRSKFLHYLPEVVIINNIEYDHADIFDTVDEIILSFSRMLRVVPSNGIAFANADDPNSLAAVKDSPCPVKTVGFSENADIRIDDAEYLQDRCEFTLEGNRYSINMVGQFNVRNAAMAVMAARFAGVAPDVIAEALVSFEGVARRQQVRGVVNGVTVIDDFAHHPTAIKQAVVGIRQRYPGSRVWAVFEPRSNTTRRSVFQHELAIAMAASDFPVIASVDHLNHIAKDVPRLDIEKMGQDLEALGKEVILGGKADELSRQVAGKARPGDVVLVMSNGGFDGIHQKLLDCLEENRKVADVPVA